MTFEAREWRAIAFGWAVGFGLAAYIGIGWWMPVSAIVVGMLIYSFWR